ncbi:hypothetical protein [Rhizobium laguerreae]|uniref:hypothetical protein n=1 Tax=Rhizobium laguerreae TaxID=1076926 RepID=UPI001C91206F|nr:hypothetical protein [Rhizobium laguerreae]
MPRVILNPHVQLCFTAILALLAIGLRPAAGTPKCPPQNELLAKAKIVVEAQVKSLSIGESGFFLAEGVPTRMIRVDLAIKKVIKGKYPGKEAIVYGAPPPPGPLSELTMMALIVGLGGDDTFEWELYRQEITDGVAFFSMNACSYYKFPVYNVGPD